MEKLKFNRKGLLLIGSIILLLAVSLLWLANRNGWILKTPKLSDLIPSQVNQDSWGLYNSEFCNLRTAGGYEIRVRVENQGYGSAPASLTCVNFGSLGNVCQNTPALAPGLSVVLTFQIPCQRSRGSLSCPFTITVNSNSSFSESNTANNTAEGACNVVG